MVFNRTFPVVPASVATERGLETRMNEHKRRRVAASINRARGGPGARWADAAEERRLN